MESAKKDLPEKPDEKANGKEIKAAPSGAKEEPAAEKAPGLKPAMPARRTSIWLLLLRWALGVLIIFGLGALTTVMLLYIPANRKLDSSQQKLGVFATQSFSDLQSANETLERLATLEANNADLQSQLDQANLTATILQIRMDIASAQLALANKDTAKAKLALSKTAEAIKKLESQLPQAQRDVGASLQNHLKIVLEEMATDPATASVDLSAMTSTLLELQNILTR